MTDSPEAITLKMVLSALDVASFRQRVIANNIANAHATGFTPSTVTFKETFESLREKAKVGGATLSSMVVVSRQTDATGAPKNVQLDMEVAALSANTLQYQALLHSLNKELAVLSIAVNDGRR